ncbi:MAG: ABC transporter substrate-binding protein [Pseudodesulfovibrio sp.]|nr:ABC transporter substrate-binding protein [Pseudodesulfovibrio sp.]
MKRFLGIIVLVFCLVGCSGSGDGKSAATSGNWSTIKTEATESTVHFYMYGGLPFVNEWIDTYVAEEIKTRYGITLVRVPLSLEVIVSKLEEEKKAGKIVGGVDLLWINGKNFKKARKSGVLFGPFAEKMPNYVKHVNKQMAAYDFGYPVEGYEVPLGRTQFVFEYDSARLNSPPKNFTDLLKWVKDNPGRFTYPRPSDFTGLAFVLQAFYAEAGGPKMYLPGWNQELFEKQAPKVWAFLNEMKPYLWRHGEEYPESVIELDELFRTGVVDICMSYRPLHAQAKRLDGQFAETVRTYVMNGGTVHTQHFVAIPESASNKAGAMVVANFLLSPEAQLSKFEPSNWGDYPAINLDTLSKEQWDGFAAVELGESFLGPVELAKASLPEIPAEYMEALAKGWEENVR